MDTISYNHSNHLQDTIIPKGLSYTDKDFI